jgi:hypothetical protein
MTASGQERTINVETLPTDSDAGGVADVIRVRSRITERRKLSRYEHLDFLRPLLAPGPLLAPAAEDNQR